MKDTFMFLVLACLLLAACNMPQRQPAPSPSVTPTVEAPEPPLSGVPTLEPTRATLRLAVHPPEKRTGVEDLDLIIDTVLAHDFEGLKTLTTYLVIGCTQADGLGGSPKCAEGEAEGTLVEVVPFLGPEGHHQRRAEYEAWQGPDVLGLLAAYRVSAGAYSDETYPVGEDALVFLDAQSSMPVTLQITDGKIVRFDYGFGGSLEDDLRDGAEEVFIPLSFNPIPTQVPWTPYKDPQGRFSFVYPPTMTLTPGTWDGEWLIGDRIEFFIHPPGVSYVTCFDQALGDCPAVQEDDTVEVNGMDVRRVKGYFGAVGGMIPQEFLTYIVEVEGEQLVFTLYALPFDAELQDITRIWPLEGMELELFERMITTVTIK
jgi:hypothetical protein